MVEARAATSCLPGAAAHWESDLSSLPSDEPCTPCFSDASSKRQGVGWTEQLLAQLALQLAEDGVCI